jgi:hypothetical protein
MVAAMKNYWWLVVWCIFVSPTVYSQTVHEEYTQSTNSLRIGTTEKDVLPYNEQGYTLILPDSAIEPKGVLISLEDGRFDLTKTKQLIHPAAIRKGFAVLYVSTGIPVDLFFSEKTLRWVDTSITQIFKKFKLPTQNVYFLGVSLAGHRALKYIQFIKSRDAKSNMNVKGVVLCDSVLDWVRQWYEEKKGVKDNFAPSAVSEGKLITFLLEENLKGTPKTNLNAYLNFSPYSYFDESNRHLRHFKELRIRAYTEPATYYWMNERRKGVFDTNFPDMVGIINEMKLLGNQKAELVVFNQGKENNDRRNPYYTWELVNKEELLDWMTMQ